MKKELGLLLVGVASFDLGAVAVATQVSAAQSAVDYFLKINEMSAKSNYIKIDNKDIPASVATCKSKHGTPVTFHGADYCQIPKTGSNSK